MCVLFFFPCLRCYICWFSHWVPSIGGSQLDSWLSQSIELQNWCISLLSLALGRRTAWLVKCQDNGTEWEIGWYCRWPHVPLGQPYNYEVAVSVHCYKSVPALILALDCQHVNLQEFTDLVVKYNWSSSFHYTLSYPCKINKINKMSSPKGGWPSDQQTVKASHKHT